MLKETGREIVEVTAFNGVKVQCVKQGSILIPVGKATIFPMGKVAMYPKDELRELQQEKQNDRKNYDKDPANEERLEKLKSLKHNWERSQQMFENLSKVGFANSIDTVNTIMSLVSAASGGYVKRSSGFWGRMPPPLAPEAGG